MDFVKFIGLFIYIAGFVVGLGAVTVIDLHGFLARKSSYWTEATIRTHKVTKPLIWLGIALVILGSFIFYGGFMTNFFAKFQTFLILILVLNGSFLSFVISPYLLKQEIEGKEGEILPQKMQNKITLSFLVSILGWWGSLVLFVYYIINFLNKI